MRSTGLQLELLDNPEAGDVEPGTTGLRKIRLGDPTRGKGKRGGARVHYLWLPHRGRIYLMFVYGKNEASTLTAALKKHSCGRSSHKSKRQTLRKSEGDEGRHVYRTPRFCEGGS